jgi:hypothetical protein
VKTSGSVAVIALTRVPSQRQANLVIENAIRYNQGAFLSSVVRSLRAHPPAGLVPGVPAYYELHPNRNLVSASSTVVSELLPAEMTVPGGMDGGTYVGVTVDVDSGQPVVLADLLMADGTSTLVAKAASTGARTNGCLGRARPDLTLRLIRSAIGDGKGFNSFVLLPAGIVLGFAQGEIALNDCGPIDLMIPYRTVLGAFSPLGRLLVSGVRNPIWTMRQGIR